MKQIKPTDEDQSVHGISVFLAGSIEMGKAEDWQSKVVQHFNQNEWNLKLTFFNPRRDEWDSSWEQKQSVTQFNHQVNWEMNQLDKANIIFMNFVPETQSPISLLELGAYGSSGKMIVCCPPGFWRKGNVDIFCTRYRIPLYKTLEEGIGALETSIRKNLSS